MFEIFWSILNLLLFISFIIISIKALKLVREKIGGFAAVILGMGILLSFIPSEKTNLIKSFDLNESKRPEYSHQNTTHEKVQLSESLMNKTWLDLTFSEEMLLKKARLSRTGLIAFTDVSPISISHKKVGDKQLELHTFYTKTWYLLGVKVYSENLDIQNTVEL